MKTITKKQALADISEALSGSSVEFIAENYERIVSGCWGAEYNLELDKIVVTQEEGEQLPTNNR